MISRYSILCAYVIHLRHSKKTNRPPQVVPNAEKAAAENRTHKNNDMNIRNYTSPSFVTVELAAESGFAASLTDDASNGAKNFIIGQDSSSYDSTWE